MIELRQSTPPAAPDREPASSPRASVRPLACLGAARGDHDARPSGTLRVLALDVDGVLTDGRVALGPRGEESKGILFRDLDAITVAKAKGFRIALVTGEDGPMVDAIASRVGPDCVL